ncbi:UDP-glucuronosyl/UDP-glucosyltransferase [Corchorus olitorius]|uniref:UDP-glucuronosyl/UDP-glucosyltransferase n=1 Tax=Corchorus olitorius TaxID=93759 RepID=A0A1R3GHJ7_9ROSI|nr:UDP-glucuronosyl/UDP-glucosyltransferase [Corchorus olitorius]
MEKENNSKVLHIVMFPWLAMGHFIPFFRLSKLLAQKGHKISFVSTPRNLSKLPKTPQNLSSQITLVSFPLPTVPNLPSLAECSMEVTYNQQQPLKHAFDLLQPLLTSFLESSKPDWIIYDYASHWLPPVAAKLGISRAFFGVFTAACLSFTGPPSALIEGGANARLTPEDFTKVPKWIPFEFNLAYRWHEVAKYFEKTDEDKHGPPDTVRFGLTIQESDLVVVRSSYEFEPDWFNLLPQLYEKPVIPVGFLPPILEEDEIQDDEKWVGVREWLDNQKVNSVVYVALGTEEKKVGVEIPRNERDGSFTSDAVAESLRLAVVEDSGEPLRETAKSMKSYFGDMGRNDGYVEKFVRYLQDKRKRTNSRFQ